jgi:uncharacterized protein (TIGR03435 family)
MSIKMEIPVGVVPRFLLISIGVSLWFGSAFGQSFEAASIKPNKSGSFNSSGHSDNGGIRLENYSLQQLIAQAYDVKDYSLTGPVWLGDDHFDIVARTTEGTPGNLLRPMLQSLLAERFGLMVHWEPKLVSGYALVAGKKPPLLHEKPAGAGSNTNTGNGNMHGTNVAMDKLADLLARLVHQPVQDQTGLVGVFDVNLEWTPEQAEPAAGDPGSIFTALQEQVGLKLEPQKVTIRVLVVDRIERVPTEN